MKSKVENGEVIEKIEEVLRNRILFIGKKGDGTPEFKDTDHQVYTGYPQLLINELNAVAQSNFDEGFKQGFEACRKDIREGKHLNCCYKKDLTNALNQQRLQIVEMVEIVKFNAKAPDDTLAMTPVERGMWYKAYYQACTDIINKIEFLTKLEK